MKKIPWKAIFICCSVLTALIVAKCINHIVRATYAGRIWYSAMQSDPWTYFGIVTAAAAVGAGIVLLIERKKRPAEA